MERVVIVAPLKPGTADEARKLVAGGPPFELASSGIDRHSVFVSSGEVVFVFEGPQVEWVVDDLIDGPFHPELQRTFAQWRAIIDGIPRLAREQFGWDREVAATSASDHGADRRWRRSAARRDRRPARLGPSRSSPTPRAE